MTQPEAPIHDVRALLNRTPHNLVCGADIDDLLEQAADGHAHDLDEHQADCPHCQAALGEFARLWEPVHAKATEAVTTPAALRNLVTAQVRRLVADVWYTLQLNDGGTLRVAARVIATIARNTARQIPGVKVALGRSTHTTIASLVEKATLGHRHPNAAVGVLGRTAVIDLALAVQYGEQLDAVAREVQHRVITELQHTIGLKTVTVNLTIDDVLAPELND